MWFLMDLQHNDHKSVLDGDRATLPIWQFINMSSYSYVNGLGTEPTKSTAAISIKHFGA